MKFRIYQDGTVVHEDNFSEIDAKFNHNNAGSDFLYHTIDVPDLIVEHIEAVALGK